MGWTVKNQSGVSLLQGSSHRRFVASAMVAEALAMKDAISSAVNTGNSFVTAIQGILHDID
ncbi:unnamed protein product [Brassica oleracea var. botrytis]